MKMGSSFLRISVGLATGGIFILKAAPHVFPKELCKRPMELKISSEACKVPERCRSELVEVASKMGITDVESKVSLFVCSGFSPLSAGATWLPNGAVIGLPRSFLFEREEDVFNSGAVFKNSRINWSSKLGTKLKESLISSDDNVAFLLGHELSHIKDADCKYEAILAPTWLYLTYKLIFSTKKLAPSGSRLLDGTIKGGVCVLSYLSYCWLNRFIMHQQEFHADEVSARCELRLARGGVDCTVKRLKLNSVLRVLHGSDGKRLYSKDGELLKKLSHPTLHERLRRLEAIVEEKMKGECSIL